MRAGHPWVYESSLRAQNRDGDAGELAVIYDRRDRFLAIGLFDPDSPLRVRVLHQGTPVTLDDAWWAARLDEALLRRASPEPMDDEVLSFGRLEIDLGGREARLDGKRCDLTGHQFELLVVLAIVALLLSLAVPRYLPRIDAEIAELVDDERDPLALGVLQHMADEGRLAGAEKAGHDCCWNLGRHGGLRYLTLVIWPKRAGKERR